MVGASEDSKKGSGEKTKKETESKMAEASMKTVKMVKQTKLGIDVKKEENLAEWYSQVSFFQFKAIILL